MQWNCRGLNVKHSEVSLHLQHFPSPILAFTEAGLPGKRSLPGYTRLTSQSIPSFPHGSAALFIRKGVSHVQLDTSHLCTLQAEFVGAKLCLGNRTFVIVVAYVRPNRSALPVKELLEWCKNITEELLICGDFNAHNEAWGGSQTDRRGEALMEVFEELELVVANDGRPTFFRPPNSYSAIDLTAHTPSLELKWEPGPDTRGSDHFPINITIRGCQTAKKIKKQCVNWDVFRAALDLTQEDVPVAIKQALKAATRTINISEWLPEPDLTYLNLAAARTRAQRRFRRTGAAGDKTCFNKVSAKLRRHARALIRNRWTLLCKSADVHVSTTKLWKILGAMTGKGKPRHTLQVLGLAANKTPLEAAEALCAIYAPAEATERPREPNTVPGPLDAPFTFQELQCALRSCRKKSAAGPDGIPYQALTNTTHEAQEALMRWFNKVWETGAVPEDWKTADIIPLLKAGKPPGRAESYRPVSLTSCVGKLFERLVQSRLCWFLEENRCLPDCMTGFRKGLSAQDNILELTSSLENSKLKRRNAVVVFLDVERAYDGVPLSSVLRRLTELGLTGKIQNFLGNFLTGRRIKVRDGSIVSNPRVVYRGLPQGSVLSPILFNLVMAKLPQHIPRKTLQVQMSIYADDICLWVAGIYRSQIYRCMQDTINATEDFLDKSGLALSLEKATCMQVRGNGRRFPSSDLTVAGSRIKQVHKQRFLGITLTNRLKWAQAVKSTTQMCRPAVNAIRCMTGASWGCSERTIAAAHAALVSSRILYRLPYMTPSRTDMEKLERLHRGGLRTAMGIPRASANEVVLREMGADPLRRQAMGRRLQQLARLATTTPGRRLLARLQERKETEWKTTMDEFFSVASSLPAATNETKAAPWEVAETTCDIRIEHLRSKRDQPALLAKAAVEDHLEKNHAGKLQIYTDGSVNRARTSSTVAFHIPKAGIEWSGKLQNPASSTTTEMVAIDRALHAASGLAPQPMVILTDSKSALQRLGNVKFSDPLTNSARNAIGDLKMKGTTICFQWVPGHVGVKGNEKADSLAAAAHQETPSVPSPTDPHKIVQDVRSYVRSKRPEPALPKGTLVGLPRAKASLLRRLRTNTAATNVFLHKMKRRQNTTCPNCNEAETVDHMLSICPAYTAQREQMCRNLRTSGQAPPHEALFPDGTRRKCRMTLKALLKFLQDTGLLDRLQTPLTHR